MAAAVGGEQDAAVSRQVRQPAEITFVNLSSQSSQPLIPSAAASAERERVAQQLALHYAADHLPMEELDARLSMVYRSQSWEELDRLTADLPPLSMDQFEVGAAPMLAATDMVPARGVIIAFMGGAERKGSWLVPRELKIFAMMGGADIDLREARFAPGVTEIDCTACMGGVEITVPRGIRVEAVGAAFMGGFSSDAGDNTALDPSQPVLRVTGLAIMGGVDVNTKKPSKKLLARFEAAMRIATRAQK